MARWGGGKVVLVKPLITPVLCIFDKFWQLTTECSSVLHPYKHDSNEVHDVQLLFYDVPKVARLVVHHLAEADTLTFCEWPHSDSPVSRSLTSAKPDNLTFNVYFKHIDLSLAFWHDIYEFHMRGKDIWLDVASLYIRNRRVFLDSWRLVCGDWLKSDSTWPHCHQLPGPDEWVFNANDLYTIYELSMITLDLVTAQVTYTVIARDDTVGKVLTTKHQHLMTNQTNVNHVSGPEYQD